MPVGGAIAASAGASLIGGVMQSNAADKASQQQAQSAANALAQQKQMFGVAQNALNPFVSAGQNALPSLQALVTPGSSAAALQNMPGFKFQSDWGNLAATNQLAAEGLGGSAGPLGKALSDYNQGLAGTYYQNSVNALQGYVNSGLGAGQALAGNAITGGNSMAGTIQNQGNALAAGTLGSANALAGGLQGAGNSASSALLLSKLLGNNSNNGLYGGTWKGIGDQLSSASSGWFGTES